MARRVCRQRHRREVDPPPVRLATLAPDGDLAGLVPPPAEASPKAANHTGRLRDHVLDAHQDAAADEETRPPNPMLCQPVGHDQRLALAIQRLHQSDPTPERLRAGVRPIVDDPANEQPSGTFVDLFTTGSVGNVFVYGPRAFVTFFGKNTKAAVVELDTGRVVRHTVPAHPLIGDGQPIIG